MNVHATALRPIRRALAGLLAFLTGFGPLTPLALAAETPLADAPISVSIKAHPNIVFTMDDSTSMQLDFLPDYVVVNSLTNAATTYCRGATSQTGCGNTGSSTMPQYHYAEWVSGATGSGAPWPSGYGNRSDGPPVVMASEFNALFYNPNVTYTAPMKYDGTSYPDMTASGTTNWRYVPADPYLYPAKYVDLRAKVNVGIWCNSDYADKVTNGDGTTISTDICRINGRAYAAGGNGAPKVLADYNYPFGKVAADADNSKYFSQNTNYVWCKASMLDDSAATPRTCCPVPLEDRPIGCDPGCKNPAECTVCTKQCPVAQVTDGAICGWNAAGKNTSCTSKPASLGGSTTLQQDANNKAKGLACRRNNFKYDDGMTTDGWTLNSAHVTFKTRSGSCGSTTSATAFRHYYKTSVVWCKNRVSTSGNDKWRGYGKDTCQEEKNDDLGYIYPLFYQYLGSTDNYANAAFQQVELDFLNKKLYIDGVLQAGGTITHALPGGDTITRGVLSDKPEESELVNYANWFAYYRTRIIAAKSVTSIAFSDLTDKFRVGFHRLSNVPATDFVTLADFKGGAGNQRQTWYSKLAGVSIPMGNATPLLDGVVRIGEWFKSTSGTSAQLTGSTNPINLSCQKSYHIMFTDGYTNQPAKPTFTVGNIDGAVIPTLPETILDLKAGDAWPLRYREGATAVDDSLSDYAMHYWLTDLRPGTFDKSVAENNVPTTENDPAKWQHLNFAALSLGTEGKLPSRNVSNIEAKIAAGTLKWTTPSPNVYRPGTTGVDDLWHAAVTGRSQFVNARDPAELQTGMAAILNEIKNLQAARAGVAFGNVNFGETDNYIYRVTIEPGWGGTLTKVLLDPSTGTESAISTKYHDKLKEQVTAASVGDEPWYDDRRVVTWIPSKKKADSFAYDKLDSDQLTALGASADVQKKIIAYLRGDTGNEGSALKNFRSRSQILGDIVNSSPSVVGSPNAPYSDATDPGYETYRKTTRKKMLYVGANDGMLHAFDESSGAELWSYIPSFAYSNETDRGIRMLAKKDPFFKHQMFVDATPVAADIQVGGAWKTYLFGGLGKGGKGFYAVDVTAPDDVDSESKAAANVKWEFTDADLGYSYGKPLVGKLRAYDDKWVVMFTSGHNNTSGKGKLYIVDPADGTLLKTLETTAGSEGSPSGLAQVSGFVIDYHNQVIEQVYGGDLLGNVWRFDLSSYDSADFKVEKFATLTSVDGSAQSVTVAPQIEVDFQNGIDRWVMIGTGRLLDESDLVTWADQVQTMYAIRDGTVLEMGKSLPHKPRTDSGFEKLTDGLAGLSVATEKGWLHDLPKGERIIAPIQAEVNLLVYAGSLPPENECLSGLAANIYAREFTRGASQLREKDGEPFVESIYSAEGAVGVELIKLYKGEGAAQPTFRVAITRGTDGKMISFPVNLPGVSAQHRMSWRLLGQ